MAEFMKDELEGFVPKEQAAGIIKKVARGSSVMRLSNLENMTSALTAMQMFQAMQNETEPNKE